MRRACAVPENLVGATRASSCVVVRRNIVLATDLTARSDRAAERAIALAEQWNARLFAVHAIEQPSPLPSGPSWQQPTDSRTLAYERIYEDVVHRARDVNVEIIVDHGDAESLVLDVAADVDAELIVTGVSRDEYLGPTRLGSTVEALARRAVVPLLVVKRRAHGAYHRVVVATDFSKPARTALFTALDFYRGARITVFHAIQIPYATYFRDEYLRESGRECAEGAVQEHLRRASVSDGLIDVLCEHGQPDHLLADLARATRVDLIVVGRSRGRIAAFLLGSVSTSILASAPTDVMVVPAPFANAETYADAASRTDEQRRRDARLRQ